MIKCQVICNCSGQWGDYCRRCDHGKAHIPKPAQIRGVIYDVACNTAWRTCRGPSQHSTTVSHVVCVATEIKEKECRWCKHWDEAEAFLPRTKWNHLHKCLSVDAHKQFHAAVELVPGPYFGCKYWEARDE